MSSIPSRETRDYMPVLKPELGRECVPVDVNMWGNKGDIPLHFYFWQVLYPLFLRALPIVTLAIGSVEQNLSLQEEADG